MHMLPQLLICSSAMFGCQASSGLLHALLAYIDAVVITLMQS